MDFAVGGVRLWTVLQRSARGDLAEDLVPVLTFEWPVDRALGALLGTGDPDLPDGRVALYVCPECGDLGCGGITAAVDRDADTVVWRDLAFQTNYEPLDDDNRFDDVGALRFARSEYEAALSGFMGRPAGAGP